MNLFKKTTYLSLLLSLGCAVATLATGCKDDFGFSDAGPGEGETMLTLEASFSPFSEGMMTRAGSSTAGDALKGLNDLAILVYDGNPDENGDCNLIPEYCQYDVNVSGAQLSDRDSSGSNGAANGKPAESRTYSLSGININNIRLGKYYIIGVANLKGGTKKYLADHAGDEYNYMTLDGLRRMKMTWNDVEVNGENVTNSIASNGEMLGFFANADSDHVPTANSTFTPVTVNRHGMKLHAWLRRCASKITIDFDGSDLRENVYVYIKEARIRDIATDCTLGFGEPELDDKAEITPSYNNVVGDIQSMRQSEQVISYLYDGADPNNHNIGWPCITKGMPTIRNNANGAPYKDSQDIDFHSETSDALYFYENMQGVHNDPGKLPVVDSGTGDLENNAKDGVEFGSYIEVEGYYHSDAGKNVSEGKVIYRFMLGQNATDDYNAERNYHYKLTLRLKGNGNDYDWHIDYNEKKGFNVPNPWYVSYLYNHDAQMPFKYVPEDGYEVVGLKAEIIQNPWYPTQYEEESEIRDPNFEITPAAKYGDLEEPYTGNDINKYYTDENGERQPINGNGFLSLRVTSSTVITPEMSNLPKTGVDYGKTEDARANDYYYYDRGNDGAMDRSQRVYLENGNPVDPQYGSATLSDLDKARENFTYSKDEKGSYSFQIPLFTRAKVMLKKTGYTGNNPFVRYQRIAKLKLTVTLKNKETGETKDDSELVNVVQVRRVVNPKGVYRRAGNYEPFSVRMMWLGGNYEDTFEPVVSHGPWRAEIIGDANFITLDGKQTVSGTTNSNIAFTIRFNRMSTGNKNAVVRILYHNYTCTHLIFVRQGYDPQILGPIPDTDEKLAGRTPNKWSAFNMIAKNKIATDPRDEGSLFKFGNPGEPIDVINNVYEINGVETTKELLNGEFYLNKGTAENPFIMIDGDGNKVEETKTWQDILSDRSGFTGDNAFSGYEVAEIDDFEELYLNSNHEFGYGVLYADGATSTQDKINDVYGYSRYDSESGDSPKGMRGVFAYYWDKDASGSGQYGSYNGRNLFFPIGRSGYGHRKNYREGEDGKSNGNGILRYACNSGLPRTLFSNVAPLFVSIFRVPGAIYWSKAPKRDAIGWDGNILEGGGWDAYALDFNYFTFDVNCIVSSNLNMDNNGPEPHGDACFVRCMGNDTPADTKARRKKGRR